MRRFAGLFLLGVLSLLWSPRLVPWWWGVAFGGALVLAARRWRPLLWCLVPLTGWLWTHAHASARLAAQIDARQDAIVTGCIVTPVTQRDGVARFLMATRTVGPVQRRLRLLLRWYGAPALEPGECWRLSVRIAPPRGHVNPGGFDYEKYLFVRGVGASGYVRDTPDHERVTGLPMRMPLLRLRLAIADQIAERVTVPVAQGLMTALAVGLRDRLDRDAWRTLNRTGTSHLVAISGLHIGMVAAAGFLLGRWLPLPFLQHRGIAHVHIGIALGLVCAVLYATLAGFSLPTRRALIMLAVGSLALVAQRELPRSQVFAAALVAVLIADPLAPLTPGLWLSFGAVAALAIGAQRARSARPMLRLITMQGRISVGLAPLLARLSGGVSLIALPLNIVLVPLFTFVVVPVVLGGIVALPLCRACATVMLGCGEVVLGTVWMVLERAASSRTGYWPLPEVPGWIVAAALAGVTLAFMPRGFPGRALGIVLIAPIFLWRPAELVDGQFRATVLDVGQGLSVVIETRSHRVVYDSGDRWGGSSAADAVVIPYLRSRGTRELTALIVSHNDRDHSGGADGVLREFVTRRLLAGESLSVAGRGAEACRVGRSWRLDGVVFSFLHPNASPHWSGNNSSCVIRVSGAGGALLLTGDIEWPAESFLARNKGMLRADIVVVPHHGSATSSSKVFVDAVEPDYAVFPVGFANRWGFPRPEIAARYEAVGARVFDTGVSGAVLFDVHPDDGIATPRTSRESSPAVWRAKPEWPAFSYVPRHDRLRSSND